MRPLKRADISRFESLKRWVLEPRFYDLGGQIEVHFNPHRSVAAHEGCMVLEAGILDLTRQVDVSIKHWFICALEAIADSGGLESARIWDLSGTCGLFAMLAERLGARSCQSVSPDPKLVVRNFLRNGSNARCVPPSRPSLDGDVDLILFDLTMFPSKLLLGHCAKSLSHSGSLFVSGMIGQQAEVVAGWMLELGLSWDRRFWVDEDHGILFRNRNWDGA